MCDCRILKSDVHNFSFSFFLFQLNVHYHSRIFQSILKDTVNLEEKKTKKQKKQKEIERSWKHTPKKNHQFNKSTHYIYINS